MLAEAELVTYEQVASWLRPEVRAAIEELTGLGGEHGTNRGYLDHRLRRQTPCRDCLAAYRAARTYRAAPLEPYAPS